MPTISTYPRLLATPREERENTKLAKVATFVKMVAREDAREDADIISGTEITDNMQEVSSTSGG
jgi:hypothetical protein